jgi:hypothetical protein
MRNLAEEWSFLSPVILQKLIDVHLLVCNADFGEIGREASLSRGLRSI